MRFAAKLLIITAFLTTFVFTAQAQKRRKTTGARTTTSVSSASDVKASAEKVSIQIKNVSKFIYILGGVAKGIEDIDKDVRAGKASKSVVAQNEQFKQSVIQSIKNLRAGLVALEIEFRTKPALKNYLFPIQGISDLAGNAEDQATNGQMTQSGKTLLSVIEKLSDTLVAMP